jgi:hypothetical protein
MKRNEKKGEKGCANESEWKGIECVGGRGRGRKGKRRRTHPQACLFSMTVKRKAYTRQSILVTGGLFCV